MTKKINILIGSLIITIGLFTYLTIHHFAVKLGISGSALCSISSTLNCDAAALSQFSEIFKLPIAILGAVFHLALLGLIVFLKLNWLDESIYLKKFIQLSLIFSAITSIIMALISFFLIKVACPFCLGTYVFSFINLFLGWNIVSSTNKEVFDFSSLFSDQKYLLIILFLIPTSSWFISGIIKDNYGLSELDKVIPEKLALWKNSTVYQFNPDIGLNNKVSNAKAQIVEFADFKCPHCKQAHKTISTYLKSHPEVNFTFKPFPLDGNCNTSDKMQKGDGTRCKMAAWVLCSEKIAQKGWDIHHWLFENQEEFSQINDLNQLLPQIEKDFQIKSHDLSSCADSNEIYEQIKKSSQEGNSALVHGTPTIYLNGKKLEYGHIMEVLKKAVEQVK